MGSVKGGVRGSHYPGVYEPLVGRLIDDGKRDEVRIVKCRIGGAKEKFPLFLFVQGQYE